MKTASLECQIAREQLKRYQGGVKLAPELVRGLERHLSACPECLQLARQSRQPAAKTAVKTKKMPGFALVDAAKAAVSKPTDDKRKASTRTAILGGLLVLTLVAMGAISRNPEGMLGQRAIAAAATANDSPEATKAPIADPTPIEAINEPMKGEPMPMVAIVEEAPPVVETPPPAKPVVRATVTRSQNRAPARRPAPRRNPPSKPKSDSGSIRVYDANGRPIQPN